MYCASKRQMDIMYCMHAGRSLNITAASLQGWQITPMPCISQTSPELSHSSLRG